MNRSFVCMALSVLLALVACSSTPKVLPAPQPLEGRVADDAKPQKVLPPPPNSQGVAAVKSDSIPFGPQPDLSHKDESWDDLPIVDDDAPVSWDETVPGQGRQAGTWEIKTTRGELVPYQVASVVNELPKYSWFRQELAGKSEEEVLEHIKNMDKILFHFAGMELLLLRDGDTARISEKDLFRLQNNPQEALLEERDQNHIWLVVLNHGGLDLKAEIDPTTRRLTKVRNFVLHMWLKTELGMKGIDLPYANYVVYNDEGTESGFNVGFVFSLTKQNAAYWATGAAAGFNFRYSKEAAAPGGDPEDRPRATIWDTRVNPKAFTKLKLRKDMKVTDVTVVGRVSSSLKDWMFGVLVKILHNDECKAKGLNCHPESGDSAVTGAGRACKQISAFRLIYMNPLGSLNMRKYLLGAERFEEDKSPN